MITENVAVYAMSAGIVTFVVLSQMNYSLETSVGLATVSAVFVVVGQRLVGDVL